MNDEKTNGRTGAINEGLMRHTTDTPGMAGDRPLSDAYYQPSDYGISRVGDPANYQR